jgi:hypothetical protein
LDGLLRAALLVLVVIAALVLLAVTVPDIGRATRVDGVTETTDGWFVDARALVGIGLWIALWAVFLPTGVLAWREPDALEPETADARLGEPVRDAMLGIVLAGGIAISLFANSDAGLWPFLAALALLGALGRRAAGQPMMSRQRKWRVAIGIALLAILVVAGMLAQSGGG